ncbi:MAG: 30S ribosomal protein S16 [Desulfurellaceae bacterium]|nr:30S ribosomal protein S16 [Desulfurellaceae bacterium]
MMVKIRLARHGAKKRPFYRIVAADSRSPRDGRFLERLGSYDPTQDPALVEIKQDRLAEWLKNGAQPTGTVARLIKKAGRAKE